MLKGDDVMKTHSLRSENQHLFLFEEITIEQLHKLYDTGEYTIEEVIRSFLERIEQYELTYNAFTFMNEQALTDAKTIDAKRMRGEKVGPLAGIPVVVKEAVDMVGFPSTFGWAPLSKHTGGIELLPQKDATIISRLKAADAIILGKTNIPAFSCAYHANTSWKGPTYNAVNRKLTPGGSSSGTATAVSGNFTVLGVAEETAGSIQVPAAAQGIVGIKPSFGLIPTTGVTPLAGSTRDVLGPHARTVRDAAIMLDVIAGYSPDDAKTISSTIPEKGYTSFLSSHALKGKRIGLYGPSWRETKMTAETEALYKKSISILQSLGAEVIEDPFHVKPLAPYMKTIDTMIGRESFFYDLNQYFKNLDPSLNMEKVFLKAGAIPWEGDQPLASFVRPLETDKAFENAERLPDLTRFKETKNELLRTITYIMAEQQLDAFVYPTMLEDVPTLDSEDVATSTISEINISGLPLITIPAGFYSNSSPFNLAFFSTMWSEGDLLGMAYAYEKAAGGRKAPQLVKKE